MTTESEQHLSCFLTNAIIYLEKLKEINDFYTFILTLGIPQIQNLQEIKMFANSKLNPKNFKFIYSSV